MSAECLEDPAPFTLMGQCVSEKVSDFLIDRGHGIALRWKLSFPVYHFEVVVNTGDKDSNFDISISQLNRVGTYHYSTCCMLYPDQDG